jgi:hypothetical protein
MFTPELSNQIPPVHLELVQENFSVQTKRFHLVLGFFCKVFPAVLFPA